MSDGVLLSRVAAAKEVRFLEEVGALCVELERRQAFTRDQRLHLVGPRRLGGMIAFSLLEFLELRVAWGEPLERSLHLLRRAHLVWRGQRSPCGLAQGLSGQVGLFGR